MKYKKTPPPGQAYCEICGKPFLDWTVAPILIDGQFFDACKGCRIKAKEKTNEPIVRVRV